MSFILTRRQFLKFGALTVGSVAMGSMLQRLLDDQDAHELRLRETFRPTVCLLCPSGCGMVARVIGDDQGRERLVKLEGNPMHPINQETLCPKGQAALELLYNPDRLTGPMVRRGSRGSGRWESISWDEAVRRVAAELARLRQEGHPERAVFLYGAVRGQMRAFIERFMAAFGSPNAISHDSLNIEAAKLANYLTQGIYDLPAYDLENANYVLSFGASMLEAGRQPLRTISGFSYLRRGRAERGKVVMIDPRQGLTGVKADEWVPIVPGTDGALALGIANAIIQAGMFDSDFCHHYAFGFENFVDDQGRKHKGFKSFVQENYDPRRVERITGVPATTIARLAGEFAANTPSVALLPGKGGLLNGSINGLYAAMAIHMLNALVGSVESPGGVLSQRYFPYTPWPDLPADPLAEAGRQVERIDGAGTRFPLARHAYQAVADHIVEGYPYPVEALFLYGTNPVFQAPGGQRFLQAFEHVPFIVSFSSFLDESAQYADLVLPEPTFLERWQDDAVEGMGYPGVGLRQPVVPPLYDTLSTGDFLLRVADAMGGHVEAAFPWESFEEVVRFRLQSIGVDWETLRELGVWLLPGYRFARRGSATWISEVVGRDRRRAPRDGRFDFYSRELAGLLAGRSDEELEALGISLSGDPAVLPHHEPVAYDGDREEYPFLLNVVTLLSLGPYSAAANLPTLQEISGMTVGEVWDSWLEMNPEAAQHLGLHDEEMVWVESPAGRLKVKLRLVPGLRPDVVNLPYNQGHKAVGHWAQDRGVNGLEIMGSATERLSGLAAYTKTRVKVYTD